MTAGTVIGVILLAMLVIWAILHAARKAKKGGGCCGEHDPLPTKKTVADRDKTHYPYKITVKIGGMTCANCAVKVENALNELDGIWASVSVDAQTAHIRSKQPPDMALLAEAVRNAGYVILS